MQGNLTYSLTWVDLASRAALYKNYKVSLGNIYFSQMRTVYWAGCR